MKQFNAIRIGSVERETADAVVIGFDIPDDLKSIFAFRPGQYLTLRAQIGNQDVRRSYSLCSSPLENKWQVAVKKIDGGLFSTFANEQLKVGDVIDVMPPEGSFTTELRKDAANDYVFFAAGSGITPILSLMKTILATEAGSTCKLFSKIQTWTHATWTNTRKLANSVTVLAKLTPNTRRAHRTNKIGKINASQNSANEICKAGQHDKW